jgi:hypothetical protein
MRAPDRFEQGLTFFNNGEYYEAHEAWEDAWRAADGAIKGFYQGLIQAAVGLYHLQRQNNAGARSQLTKSLANLSAHSAAAHGIDHADLIVQLTAVRDHMRVQHVRIARQK